MRTADRSGELADIVLASDWFVGVLRAVRDTGLPDAWTGAGVLRDLVWGELYGPGFDPAGVRDVDVAFFDPGDLGRERDRDATAQLHDLRPEIPWEATNQAAVHTWFHTTFHAEPVPPLTSTADGVATWPERATSVAVRLTADEGIETCAPLGADDLLDGVWRRNPRRITVEQSRIRLTRHNPSGRWPGVRVIKP